MEENGNAQPENREIPNPTSSTEEEVKQEEEAPPPQQEPPPSPPSTRTPFTSLSQVEADLALARTIQEQERAFMMLRMNSEVGGASDYGSWETGSHLRDEEDDDEDDDFDDPEIENDNAENDNANIDTNNNTNHNDNNEEGHLHGSEDKDDEEEEEEEDDDDDMDAFDAHIYDHDDDDDDDDYDDEEDEDDNLGDELDLAVFASDEEYARALQDAEEREMAARLFALAGIHDLVEREDHGGNTQDMYEEVDPDELSYEELLALGEVVGTESRGLSADTIASLPSIKYKTGSNQNGTNDSCVICRLDYEDGETLTLLSCKHSYHSECINNWLKINKACPVCSTEVSTSGHS